MIAGVGSYLRWGVWRRHGVVHPAVVGLWQRDKREIEERD